MKKKTHPSFKRRGYPLSVSSIHYRYVYTQSFDLDEYLYCLLVERAARTNMQVPAVECPILPKQKILGAK